MESPNPIDSTNSANLGITPPGQTHASGYSGFTDTELTRLYEQSRPRVNNTLAPRPNTSDTIRGPSLDDYGVRETIRENFDDETLHVAEAVLSAHAVLAIEDASPFGLVVVGVSGTGKTTVLRFIEGGTTSERMFYRSDDVTPAAFVSHNASVSTDDLDSIDLLPKIQHKTLVSRDMATWFEGTRENIREKMATMANVMDGDGYTRDSGTHGQRGYEGDYRFNFIGASTPLDPRAWETMGHVGNRLVFIQKPNTKSINEVVDDVFGESEYSAKVAACREVVDRFLGVLWKYHGGYGGVTWTSKPGSPNVAPVIGYLTDLVAHARAPAGPDAKPEGTHRLATAFRDIARGHALISGRTAITLDDIGVCTRVALGTIPRKRRPVIQALVDPRTGTDLTAADIETTTDWSRPTTLSRMKLVANLGIADLNTDSTGRQTQYLTLKPQFEWPAAATYPLA